MKATLSSARRPLLAGNMSRSELVREAEHTFPNPSPIVQRMIEELRGDRTALMGGDRTALMGGDKALPIIEHVHAQGQCPACGAHLTVEMTAP